MIAGTTFLLGFVIGSGRWELLTRTGRNLLKHMGVLISDYANLTFRETQQHVRETLQKG